MNSKEFVAAIEKYVSESAAEDVILKLKKPPGRRPASQLKESSEWYNSLSEQDAAQVQSVIRYATDNAVFSFLVVLDGARKIDDEKGRFELFYVGGQRVLLNPPSIDLHDLLGTSDSTQ